MARGGEGPRLLISLPGDDAGPCQAPRRTDLSLEVGMPDSHPSPTHLRSALFVDFDNIYLGLQREDPVAAEQFATDPGRWLLWLQDKLPHHDAEGRRRM